MRADESGVEPPDVVTDAVLDGRVTLRQFRRGHRAGTDAVLLAASVRLRADDRMVDVGSGVGTVGLMLAAREPGLTGLLLEADPDVADLAAQNCRLNGVEDRIRVAPCDLFDSSARRRSGIENERATLVVTNPPFFAAGEVRASPDPRKAGAHVLGDDGHAAWLVACLSLLVPKGRFHAIHRADVLPAWLAAGEGRLGAVTVIPVHARADAPAIRILVSGIKGSRAPFRLGAPVVLYGSDGASTPLADGLHRGSALIDTS